MGFPQIWVIISHAAIYQYRGAKERSDFNQIEPILAFLDLETYYFLTLTYNTHSLLQDTIFWLIGFVFVFKYNYKTHFSNFYDHKSWPDSSKTIEHEFVLLLEKTANQNNATTKYFVPIGQFWNMSTKIILESFLTVSPKLLNAACSLGKQQVPIVQSFGLNPGGHISKPANLHWDQELWKKNSVVSWLWYFSQLILSYLVRI